MKRFKLTSGLAWEAIIEVDVENPLTIQTIKDSVEFWGEWEEWLELHDGDYVRAFLVHLGEKLAFLATGNSCREIIREFEDYEGWPPLDGSRGIRLIDCETYLFDDISVEEVNAA